MRREGSASAVLGRSSEMRAGLSIVKPSGCGRRAGQVQRQLQLIAVDVCTSIDCSWLGGRWHRRCIGGARTMRCEHAGSPSQGSPADASAQRMEDGPFHSMCLPADHSFRRQAPAGRSMYPPSPSGMISTNAIFDGVIVGDLAVIGADVLTDDDAMHAPVLGLHQAVVVAAEIQRAHHLQRVERVLFQVTRDCDGCRDARRSRPPEPPGTNGERMSWSA